MSKLIYYAGSIRGGRQKEHLYKFVIDGLKDSGYTVLSEHVGKENIVESERATLTEKEIHDRDIEWINQADIVIADVSLPSLGVGYEISYALHKLEKPVFVFCEAMDFIHVSAMIKGVLPIAQYISEQDYLRQVLQSLLKHHVNGG